MMNETVRVIADALESVDYGVNAQLAALTMDGNDERPALIVGIHDETRDDDVAVGRYPETLPALVVTVDGDSTLKGAVMSDNRDGEVNIIVRYLQQDTANAKARQDGYNTMRAIQRTLHVLFSNDHNDDRTRNGIQVIECTAMQLVSTFHAINDAMLASALRIALAVRDDQP